MAGWQQCWFWSHTVCRSHPHHSGRVRYGTGASCHCMGFNSRAQPGSLMQQDERPCTDCRRPPEGAPRCSSDACPLRKLRGRVEPEMEPQWPSGRVVPFLRAWWASRQMSLNWSSGRACIPGCGLCPGPQPKRASRQVSLTRSSGPSRHPRWWAVSPDPVLWRLGIRVWTPACLPAWGQMGWHGVRVWVWLMCGESWVFPPVLWDMKFQVL